MTWTKPKAGTYLYSEIFHSIQGEGHYTGHPTVWLRLFKCNLNCNGFGQKDPTNPETYVLPYKDLEQEIKADPDKYKVMEDLPVVQFGCDSSYSWSAGFKKLQRQGNAVEICRELIAKLMNEHNPDGLFRHPVSGLEQHLCITGGEPLLVPNQRAIIDILQTFRIEHEFNGNMPRYITFETNGTQMLKPETWDYFVNKGHGLREVFFSVSPKLWTVAGEKNEKAIRPQVVKQYQSLSSVGQLKFVVGPEQRQWDELDRVIDDFRAAGVLYPVTIMPVSATVEGQQEVAGTIADMALARGYGVSARVHCYLWGNAIGT